MKKIVLFLLFFISVFSSFATHIIGGELRYIYVGPGTIPNSKQYRISLLLLRGPTGAAFIPSYVIGVFNNDNNQKIPGTADNNNWLALEDSALLNVPILTPPCIENAPSLQYCELYFSIHIRRPFGLDSVYR